MSPQTIPQLLVSAPGEWSRPATVEFGRDTVEATTRAELLERIARLSAGLQAAGLEHGDRVVLLAPNGRAWIMSALAVIHAGGALVPLDTQMTDEDLASTLADCAPRFLFTTSSLQERVSRERWNESTYLLDEGDDEAKRVATLLCAEPIDPRPERGDLAAIFYTSGTTGAPKGVALTHGNLCANIQALCSLELASEADRVAVPLPFHHVYPFTVGLLVPLALGAAIIVPHSLVGPQIVRALRDGEATVLLGVPRLYEALWDALRERVAARGRLATVLFGLTLGVSSAAYRHLRCRLGRFLFRSVHAQLGPELRLVVSGGAALDPTLARKLQGFGWNVGTGYGLSETSPILTFNPPQRPRLESAGMALAGVELAIDTSGEWGKRGELLARGPNVFTGYWNLPEWTETAFDAGGWFHTGDLAELDRDNYHDSGGLAEPRRDAGRRRGARRRFRGRVDAVQRADSRRHPDRRRNAQCRIQRCRTACDLRCRSRYSVPARGRFHGSLHSLDQGAAAVGAVAAPDGRGDHGRDGHRDDDRSADGVRLLAA